MDLVGGYLLILLLLFSGNIALLLGNYRLNNQKAIAVSAVFFIMTFLVVNTSNYLKLDLLDYFSIIFLAIAISTFVLTVYCFNKDNLEMLLYSIMFIFIISALLVSCQTDTDFFTAILYSLLVFIILFVVYQLTKLLQYAKRQYSMIICEYMCLVSILVFILALTYESTRNLDYTMFSSFLILTPTYQLIYVIIGIIVILIAGVIINDKGGNS